MTALLLCYHSIAPCTSRDGISASAICHLWGFVSSFNPICLRRGPICPQDIFYSISLVFQSPVSFLVEYSMQIIQRLQRKQKCKILASQTFLITIL